MSDETTEIVSVQWSKAIGAQVRLIAATEERSMSSVIRQAVREWLKQREEQRRDGD